MLHALLPDSLVHFTASLFVMSFVREVAAVVIVLVVIAALSLAAMAQDPKSQMLV
jgi:hypothetical protein